MNTKCLLIHEISKTFIEQVNAHMDGNPEDEFYLSIERVDALGQREVWRGMVLDGILASCLHDDTRGEVKATSGNIITRGEFEISSNEREAHEQVSMAMARAMTEVKETLDSLTPDRDSSE